MSVTAPVYIEDIMSDIVQATSDKVLATIQQNEKDATGSSLIQAIRFSYSSFDELIETLLQADKSESQRELKYPCIHLVQDITIKRGQDVGFYGSILANIIFMHQTQQTFKTQERDQYVFKPVLWPIYYQFMEQMKLSPWILADYDTTGEFKHDVIKRAFWGTRQLQASKNRLNDYVDAIEVQNLLFKINFSNC